MIDHSETTAREVHALLLDARPEADNANLAEAAHLAETAGNPRDPFQMKAFVAIQGVRTAIESGTSAAEAQSLLLDAIASALHWATAVRPEGR